MRSRLLAATCLGLALSMIASRVVADAVESPADGPSPRLTPAEAIRVQLEALAHNDTPSKDAGIAVVWRFASPGNQVQTGPLPKFGRMIHDSYAEMLDHHGVTLATTVIKNGQALQGVELVDRAGLPHRYIFILSKQADPPFKDCWMTDGVINSPADKPALAI